MSRIAVVGAGVAGLASAARLAAAGHTVTVYERAGEVGGKLGRYERHTPEGVFRFDTGPSLITIPQIYRELFTATGADLDDYLELVELNPIVRHRFADGSLLDSCRDPVEFAARIDRAFGGRAAGDWQRLWSRAAKVWDTSWRHVLTQPIDSPRQLASLAWRVPELATIAPWRSLRGLGRQYLSDPRLRVMLDRYATYTGADPRRAPAALVAIPYAELAFGGWYPRGGLGTLADALLRRCTELGVTVRTGTTVTGVDTAGGRVHGVRLADGAEPSDVVVANADALTVYRDLLPDRRRAARLGDRSLAGFVLLLGVRGRTPGLAHHSVFFPTDYDAEFDAVFGNRRRGFTARPVPDPTVFITAADDPVARPDGYESWFVLINAPRHGAGPSAGPSAVDWRVPGMAEAYADRVLAVLAERGVDVRDRVLFREIRTPADLESRTWSPGGSIYGTASHGMSGLMRPATKGPVPGLFLTGGSVHPGGGLPLVTLSARIVADRIGPA